MGTLEQVARAMFDAYNAEGPNPNKTWDGKDVPPWEALNDQVRGKWKAAAALGLRHTPAAISMDAVIERNRVAWEESVQRVVTPLIERIDTAEKRAAEVDAAALKLQEQVRLERDEQDKQRLDEARKRFRASLIIELLSGQLASNTFDWNMMVFDGERWSHGDVDDAANLVDAALKKAGL